SQPRNAASDLPSTQVRMQWLAERLLPAPRCRRRTLCGRWGGRGGNHHYQCYRDKLRLRRDKESVAIFCRRRTDCNASPCGAWQASHSLSADSRPTRDRFFVAASEDSFLDSRYWMLDPGCLI